MRCSCPGRPFRASHRKHRSPPAPRPLRGGQRRAAAAGGSIFARAVPLSSRANARDLLHRDRPCPSDCQRCVSKRHRCSSRGHRRRFFRHRCPSDRQRRPSDRRACPSNPQRRASKGHRWRFFRHRCPSDRQRRPSDRRACPSERRRCPSKRHRCPSKGHRCRFFRHHCRSNRQRRPSNRQPDPRAPASFARGPTPRSGGGGICGSRQPHRLVIPSEREGAASAPCRNHTADLPTAPSDIHRPG
jgi:hypothetical protein